LIFDISRYSYSELKNIISLKKSQKRESDLFNIDKLFKNIFSKFPELNIHDNKSINDFELDNIINKIKTNSNYLDPDNNLLTFGASTH
jgi:hypothetical protein